MACVSKKECTLLSKLLPPLLRAGHALRPPQTAGLRLRLQYGDGVRRQRVGHGLGGGLRRGPCAKQRVVPRRESRVKDREEGGVVPILPQVQQPVEQQQRLVQGCQQVPQNVQDDRLPPTVEQGRDLGMHVRPFQC
eukprot:scaffold2874_cov116-Isochrysis_galbana.AAC.4